MEVLITEIIQPLPNHPPPNKILKRLWNKNFLTEIYGNIQTFAFKELQECSSWPLINGAVQVLILKPNRTMFAGKFAKPERFLAVLLEHIFEQHCIIKWVIFFNSFCWLWDFLLADLKLKKTLIMSTRTCGRMFYVRNNIFVKRIPNMRSWNIYIFFQISFFGGML